MESADTVHIWVPVHYKERKIVAPIPAESVSEQGHHLAYLTVILGKIQRFAGKMKKKPAVLGEKGSSAGVIRYNYRLR